MTEEVALGVGCSGFEVWGLEFGVERRRLRGKGLGFGLEGLGCRV